MEMCSLRDLRPFFDDTRLHLQLARLAYSSHARNLAEEFHVAAELRLSRIRQLLDTISLERREIYAAEVTLLAVDVNRLFYDRQKASDE